jgi:D-glycerate 3-kinase
MPPLSTLLSQILLQGEPVPASVLSQLAAWELADDLRAKAFGITPTNVESVIEARSRLFQSIYPTLLQVSATLSSETLWQLWLPLAQQLAASRKQLGRPFIQGILGGQGTGKSTLAAILKLILGYLGYPTLCLSLDDLYKTYAERLALKEEDPRLIWRGPPGTHDIQLGLTILDQLRYANSLTPVHIPRFDKSAYGGAGDRREAEVVVGIDIVLFEGWFVGLRPIDPAAFDTAPPPIETDADRRFARDMNQRLQDYLPLWERLDQLILLYPVDYHLSLQWRRQAEHEMIAAGKSGMTDAEINKFVNYFWRSLHPDLFIKPLTNNPDLVDLVIEIDADHHSLPYLPQRVHNSN